MKGIAMALIGIIMLAGIAAAGTIPHLLNVQGYVTNSGSPYTGNLTLTVSTSGNADTYTTGAVSVSASGGRFNQMIGPITPTANSYKIDVTAIIGQTTISIPGIQIASNSGSVIADNLTNFMGKQVFWDSTNTNKLCYYDPPNATTPGTCSADKIYLDLGATCGTADTDASFTITDAEAAAYCKTQSLCKGGDGINVNYDKGSVSEATSNGLLACAYTVNLSAGLPSNSLSFDTPKTWSWKGGMVCELSTDTPYNAPLTQNKYCTTLSTPGNNNADDASTLGGKLPSFYTTNTITTTWDKDGDGYIDSKYVGPTYGDCDDTGNAGKYIFPGSPYYATRNYSPSCFNNGTGINYKRIFNEAEGLDLISGGSNGYIIRNLGATKYSLAAFFTYNNGTYSNYTYYTAEMGLAATTFETNCGRFASKSGQNYAAFWKSGYDGASNPDYQINLATSGVSNIVIGCN